MLAGHFADASLQVLGFRGIFVRRSILCATAAFALFASEPAQAAWHQAKSKHFIIYSDQSPASLNAFATKLEKFDQAVRRVMRMDDPAVGDGNRLTVFVLANESAVEKMSGNKHAAGFYTPRASGSLAFVPQRTDSTDRYFSPELIFFHEYAHHLMLQDLDRPYPEWLVEGFAEFMSTAQIRKDGSVRLGDAAQHRAYSLVRGEWLPLPDLLAGNYSKLSAEQREASVYARGWLLTHYLIFDPKRDGQIQRYLASIANGTPPLQAATEAFGDLKQLERDLKSYLSRISGSITAMLIAAENSRAGPIEVRPLSPGASLVMPLRQRSKRGVNSTTAEPLAVQVRQVQARFPGDELVEATLAEAEFDVAHAEASEAAADRALKANPRNTEALIYKGRAMGLRAERLEGAARAALFQESRRVLISANKIDVEDPEPLLEFYRSFLTEGQRPTANAVAALHYASDLVPQDVGLRMNSALQFLRDSDLKAARRRLAPIAFDPHGRTMAEAARKMIDKIDAGDGQGALKAAQVDEGSSAATGARNGSDSD